MLKTIAEKINSYCGIYQEISIQNKLNMNNTHLKIKTIYATLDEYITKLKHINQCLRTDSKLDPNIFHRDQKEMYLSDFLTPNIYSDKSQTDFHIKEFLNEVVMLQVFYFYLRAKEEVTSLEEYNFIMIGKIFLDSNELLDELYKISDYLNKEKNN